MSDLLDYRFDGKVAVLTLDDGKANAYSHDALDALGAALDRAEEEARAVVLAGRPGRFSAGFDLSVMTSGVEPMRALVKAGARTAVRVFTFPRPVVAACTGHGLAMGAIMLLACDVRIGAEGAFKLGMNEVAIGMNVPHFAMELARFRMRADQFHHVLFGRTWDPEGAVAAGYLDRTVPADEVVDAALAEAAELSALNSGAFAMSKALARQAAADGMLANLDADIATLGAPTI